MKLRRGYSLFVCGIFFFDKNNEKREKMIGDYLTDYQGYGCFIVYDITNKESFDIKEKLLDMIPKGRDIPICLLGNKNDLTNERKVSKEEGEEWAKGKNILFLETSVKMIMPVLRKQSTK